MPELSQLQRVKPITTVVDMGDGDCVRIVFNRNAITSEWAQANRTAVDEGEESHVLAKALATVILQWDVTDDGVALEANADNIGRLSISAQGSLFLRIMKASVPTSEEGNGSSNSSSSPSESSSGTQGNHQSSTQPSPSQPPSASPSPT